MVKRALCPCGQSVLRNQGMGENLGLCSDCMYDRVLAQRRAANKKYKETKREQWLAANRASKARAKARGYHRPRRGAGPVENPIGMILQRVGGHPAGRVTRAKNPRYL